ncbi:hypothetical protein ACI2KR_27445 [Pseudomonas luteola]
MTVHEQIERAIELLNTCQKLQSEKDGISRDEFGVFGSRKPDPFQQDIHESIRLLILLNQIYPIYTELNQMALLLESHGKIKIECGDSLSEKALEYIKAQLIQQAAIQPHANSTD